MSTNISRFAVCSQGWCMSLLVLVLVVGATAGVQAQIGDDDVVAISDDGTVWTRAKVDSVLADQPEYIRRAYRKEGLVWQTQDQFLSFETLAAACGPILWFSPDEPLLRGRSGLEINMPTAMGFEQPSSGPVAYYRVRTVIEEGAGSESDEPVLRNLDPERRTTLIDLAQVSAIDLDFFFYYPSEEGVGAHNHDVESVEMKLLVVKARRYPELGTWIVLQKVVAKAHGNLWYDNTLEVDRSTLLPVHLLVEEGKHATCTDKNGDGFYSPGYDVNQRVNDAWGVRDVMASGGLFTGDFKGWMAKPRTDEYRVFPPLPESSPIRDRWVVDGVFAPGNAVYEVRPFPRPEDAEAYDHHLAQHFIADKGDPDWPEVETMNELKKLGSWVTSESFVKSVSVAYRYDGNNGFSVVFPLLVVKHVEEPLSGGWLVNRVYFKDKKLRDVAWNVLYTPSASRWIDSYFAFGWEWDWTDNGMDTHVMTEVGIKLRFTVSRTPLGFLGALTDFWGVRFGVKNLGFWDWDRIGYAVEVGAGAF